MKIMKELSVLSVCLLIAGVAQADVVYKASTTQASDGYDPSAVTIATATGVTGTDAANFGAGVSMSTTLNKEAWSGSATGGGFDFADAAQANYDAVTNSFSGGYQTFTVTADAGKTLDLTSLDFGIARGGTSGGPRGYVMYAAIDGTLIDPASYIQRIDADTTSLRSAPLATSVDLTGAAYQGISNVTFRFYAMSDSAGRTIGFDAMTLNGSVIPEPATLGLVAAFGGGILFVRRLLQI